jgi:hypothetical protein
MTQVGLFRKSRRLAMNPRNIILAFVSAAVALLAACGELRSPTADSIAARCLPERLPSLGLVRAGDIVSYAGDSLFNYIDGAAEMYHKYDFQEVHVAKYAKDGTDATVDLYRFEGPDMAYGMYTMLRPAQPDSVRLGTEGFAYGPVLVFTKGAYLVNVEAYDQEVFTRALLEELAAAVEKQLPRAQGRPAEFQMFPEEGRLANTDKIYADSFLGRGFLTGVYTVDYEMDGEPVTLFLMRDEDGEKLRQWADAAAAPEADVASSGPLPYEDAKGRLLADSYYGLIAAGPAAGWLAGVVGYHPAHLPMLTAWLETLEHILP